MITKELESLGLTAAESKIFLYLNEHGKTTASVISKNVQVNRTTTYDALNRLLAKGFVTYTVGANVKSFMATKPEMIIKYYQEQQKKAEEVAQKLANLKKQEEELFEIYEGKKGIKTILWDILNYKEYVAFGSSGKFFEVMEHDFIQFQNQKKTLKIKSRILQTEIKEELRKVAYAKFRIIPDEHVSPVTTIVYGNKTAILIWGTIPHAILITSEQVSNQFQKQFELLWKIGAQDK
ncbi:MAG: helix-turn-helix domain-containing protein [Candidatus Pacearchaeota archaeon]|nr:helix-turn-helix domain-containing protein [Candidatus Pacearchaeota archaeon]